MFTMEGCPYCRQALKWMDELMQQYPEYNDVPLTLIDETKQPDVANQWDYYYVPTFYLDGVKVHEGGIYKNEVEALLRKALE